jgi:hypothetical protein
MTSDGFDSPWLYGMPILMLAALGVTLRQFLEKRIARLINGMEPLRQRRRKHFPAWSPRPAGHRRADPGVRHVEGAEQFRRSQ